MIRYALFLMLVSCTLCKGQNIIDLPAGIIKPETREIIAANVPTNITRSIKQDRKGNIWMAAFKGVYRYTGKSFTNITSGISEAYFCSVLEDRRGNFWFSSIGSGVYYYDPSREKPIRNFTTKDGLASDRVPCIYEDKKGNIWFGTENGASRYNPSAVAEKSFRNYRMNEVAPLADFTATGGSAKNIDNEVHVILEDRTGKFWFGTRGKAYVYDGLIFTVFTNTGKPFTNVRSIIQDKKGNIWIGGNDGLWRYSTGIFTNFTENSVAKVYEDKNGNIWTSSQRTHDGRWLLSRYEAKSLGDKKPIVTEIESEYEQNRGMILGILEANDGSIWFGGGDGVRRFDGKTIVHFRGNE